MSQTWHLPLLTTDALSDSRGYLNDAFEALRTMFSGASAPSTPVAGQLFLDTDDNVLRVYNGTAWKVIGDIDEHYLNCLPRAAGSSYGLFGDLYMGSFKIKNLANPADSGDGMNLGYADAAYAKLTGATFTGPVVMGANKLTSSRSVPDDDTELIRKDYADARLPKTGGAMTGDIAMGSNDITGLPSQSDSTPGDYAASCSYLRGKFDTSTGHDHDGTDSKRVLATNLDASGTSNGYIPQANASSIAMVMPWGVMRTASQAMATSYADVVEVTLNVPRAATIFYGSFSCVVGINNTGGSDPVTADLDIRVLNAANATQREATDILLKPVAAFTNESYTIVFSYYWTPGAAGNETFTVQLKSALGSVITVTDAVLWCNVIG